MPAFIADFPWMKQHRWYVVIRQRIRQPIRQRAFIGIVPDLQNPWFSYISLIVIPPFSYGFRGICFFKSCFPHQTKTLEKSRVFAIFGGQKTGFECNYECNWSRLTPILAGIGWDYFFIFKNIFSCLIFSTVYPTHVQSSPLWSNCRVPCLNCRISIFQMTKVFDILSS